MDHFAMDRAMLIRTANTLADIGVSLGEWVADNTLGDPTLVNAMLFANAADGAVKAATILVREALKAIPEPDDMPEIEGQDRESYSDVQDRESYADGTA